MIDLKDIEYEPGRVKISLSAPVLRCINRFSRSVEYKADKFMECRQPAFKCAIAGCLPTERWAVRTDYPANMPGFGYRLGYFDLLSSENQLITNWALRFLAQEASSCPMAMGRSSP